MPIIRRIWTKPKFSHLCRHQLLPSCISITLKALIPAKIMCFCVFCSHPWKTSLHKLPPFSPAWNRMMMGPAGPFASTGTESWCADWSGKAEAVDAGEYCWLCAFQMKAWSMTIISWYWRTITACPWLISTGNAPHFSMRCFHPRNSRFIMAQMA